MNINEGIHYELQRVSQIFVVIFICLYIVYMSEVAKYYICQYRKESERLFMAKTFREWRNHQFVGSTGCTLNNVPGILYSKTWIISRGLNQPKLHVNDFCSTYEEKDIRGTMWPGEIPFSKLLLPKMSLPYICWLEAE